MSRRGLVVSVHDVSPRTRREVELALGDLRAAGVGRVSLLVVPDHHGLGHWKAAPGFEGWLRGCEAAGHEVVAHGYLHLRARRAREPVWVRAVTRWYTAGEGEFYDLDEGESHRRAAAALAEFRGAGFRVEGFVAPAWLLGAAAEAGVRRAGYRYTVRIGGVTDFVSGRQWRSRSLVWSVRAAWRRVASRVWNGCLARAVSGGELVRIGVHPPDRAHGAVWRQVLRLAGGLARGREVETYGGWVAGSGQD